MLTETHATPIGFDAPSLLARAKTQLRHWAATRRDRALLSKLDDHILQDIGISRSQIDHLSRTR